MKSNSVFKLNKRRREKLLEILNVLYPQYKYKKITKSGLIKLGGYFLFIPIVKETFHISEFAITQLPKKLSIYRQGNVKYVEIYNKYLEFIINYQECNIIDYFYDQFQRIKTSSKVDILLEDSQFSLPESNPDSITIGTIIHQTIANRKRYTEGLDEVINLLNRHCKEPVQEQFRTLSFIIKSKKSY